MTKVNLLDIGIQHHQAGRLAEAQKIYQQILQHNPQSSDALHLLGVLAHQANQHESAVQLIQSAIKIKPKSADYHCNLANVYRALKQYDAAITTYRQAIKLNPKHIQAWGNLGNVYREIENNMQAIQCYKKVLRYNPNNPVAYNNIGGAYKADADYTQAEIFYRKAVTAQPNYADAHHNLSIVLRLQDKLDIALKHCEKALKLNPDLLHAHVNLAEIYEKQQQFDKSLETLKQILILNPNYATAYFQIGKLMYEKNQYDDALEAYHEALSREPDNAEALSNAGSIYKERGEYESAREYFEKSLALKPQLFEVRNNLGSTLLELGLLQEAYQQYQATLMQQPDNAKLYNNMSVLLRAMGQIDEALQYCEKGIKLDPEFADTYLSKSMCCLASARFDCGWAEYHWRHNRVESRLLSSLSPVEPLPQDLTGKRFLLHKDQGLGDELFFLRFAAKLKQRGAWIAYRAGKKIHSMMARQPWVDELLAQDTETYPETDYTIMIGDLPFMLGMKHQSEIPTPLRLSIEPEPIQAMKAQLKQLGKPPYIGVTWQAGAKLEDRGKRKVLSKQIGLEQIAQCLAPIKATFLVLQRNPKQEELAQFSEILGRPVHDFTALNDDLEHMLALLSCLDDYVGVSNTNMHLLAGIGKTARVLMPNPAEWRWIYKGAESPWFKGFAIYRQTSHLDWTPAIAELQRDLILTYGSERLQKLDYAALMKRAAQCQKQQDVIQAEACYRQAIVLQANSIEAWGNLGNLLRSQQRSQEAIECYKTILKKQPKHIAALNNIGNAYSDLGEFKQAIKVYEKILKIQPDLAEAYTNLGLIYKERHELDKAKKCYKKALKLKPNIPEAHHNLNNVYVSLGKLNKALECCEKSIALNDKYAAGHVGKSQVLLTMGRFESETWREYLWRTGCLETELALSPITELPQDLTGKTILVHQEQGLGDELFFLRFVSLLKQRGARVLYRAGSKLTTILRRVGLIDEVLPEYIKPLPQTDYQVLVADLPLLLGIQNADQLPEALALNPLAEQLSLMQQQLAKLGKPPYIGITWQAGTQQIGRAKKLFKQIEPALLGETLRAKKGTYLILQRNPKMQDIESFSQALGQPAHDMSWYNDDLEGMLALLSLLDDYVGVSNTNMHLLAGLDKSAQVLVPFPPEWRWQSQGQTPWFKDFSVYRQAQDLSWDDALKAFLKDL
ncbi:tetratricopeptide repeat protein [Candidatus Albibeggiatoa sp. nov. BB20]|uniref:tetratricopeptide repeat protein n=1 Tax=Candidatus Albibeggiatoa sp. nov. BB20 TaxID=3162723 RepID=UPI0033654708